MPGFSVKSTTGVLAIHHASPMGSRFLYLSLDAGVPARNFCTTGQQAGRGLTYHPRPTYATSHPSALPKLSQPFLSCSSCKTLERLDQEDSSNGSSADYASIYKVLDIRYLLFLRVILVTRDLGVLPLCLFHETGESIVLDGRDGLGL